jgi:SET domain-containing protein
MTDVIVKKSPKEGNGVFAVRNFRKGEVVVRWDVSHKFTHEGLKKLSQDDQNHTSYIGKGIYVLMQPPSKFVNHSCEPNTYVKNYCDTALRNIKKGEEITTDYSLNGVDAWELKCNCGSKKCRKIVYGDFRKLDAKTRKRLMPFLEDWYKKEILSA